MLIAIFVCAFALGCHLSLMWEWELTGLAVLLVSGMGLFFWPTSQMIETSNIQSFKSVQQTMQQQRDSGDGIEGAAFRLKIADQNSWLAKAQFWNDTLFDPYIPDEVDELQPIQ